MKHSNVRTIGIPEGMEKERGLEEIFEQIVAENFPNLAKETSICVREAERTLPKINENRPTPRHIIVQFSNLRSKETILKAAGGDNPHVRREEYQNNIRPVHKDLTSGRELARHIQGPK